MNTLIRPTHILWDVSNRNHWQIATTGTLQDCEDYMKDDETGETFSYGYEIHPNEIKDSWNNAVTGIHYDTYMDDNTDSRPMTAEEIANESL